MVYGFFIVCIKNMYISEHFFRQIEGKPQTRFQLHINFAHIETIEIMQKLSHAESIGKTSKINYVRSTMSS